MKIDIVHTEKTTGLIFKKRHHGVTVRVQFSDQEKAIIKERKLQRTVILERDCPSDVDPEKHNQRSNGRVIATALMKGRDANHFHLTIGKLLDGPDTYFLSTPLVAKAYELELVEKLPDLKDYIVENEGVSGGTLSFEL